MRQRAKADWENRRAHHVTALEAKAAGYPIYCKPCNVWFASAEEINEKHGLVGLEAFK